MLHHEKKKHRRRVGVMPPAAARLVRLQPLVESHAQSRKADGKDGEAVEEAVRAGQVGTLQTSGEKDQKNDQKRQASCREDASTTAVEPLLLLVSIN